MEMADIGSSDRQDKHKENLFPNYNNISTSLFAVFASTSYLVEIVMVRKKKNGGNVASKYSGWTTVTRNGQNRHSTVFHSTQMDSLGC
jgi:hypothetical protein